MKIGLIGPQGSGKTTFAYELAARLKKEGKDVMVITEIARSCPLPINEGTTKESQLWIMGKQMTREQSCKGSIKITDRTLLDAYCYSLWTDKNHFKHYFDFIKEYMATYDLIIYANGLDEYLIDDGTRSTDKQFRDDVDKLMKENIAKMDLIYYTLKEDRMESLYELEDMILSADCE